MADFDGNDPKKPHQAAHSGRKAQKKKSKSSHVQELNAKQRNPKAFAIQSATKAERRFRRTVDIKSKGYHLPKVDRTPVKAPPAVVAIVGPPKVGKTLLLKCLIKSFTRQKMTSIHGPVTLVSGKKKRITFIECNNDINNMIDIAKIADLVLLVIDAKSGFEMETFEFMNICQVHGMPRLMGVLTHLDLFTNKKVLQKTKTILKKRYRIEIPRGEKMFFLSGLLHGEYLKNEILNLGRFISVMKFELSSWKRSHPYVLADRMEDITDPEEVSKKPTCNRKICLYGYARGAALKSNSQFHIPGCGDYLVKNIHFLPDPCPLPDKKKKRSLNEKERVIYAPMCGVGGIVYDKDAIYIEVKEDQLPDAEEEGEKGMMLTSIKMSEQPLDEKLKTREFRLFPSGDLLKDEDLSSYDEESQNGEMSAESEEENLDDESNTSGSQGDDDVDEDNTDIKKHKKKVRFAEGEDDFNVEDIGEKKRKLEQTTLSERKRSKTEEAVPDEDEEEFGHVKWKENLIKKAADDFYQRQNETQSLQKLVYGPHKNQQFNEEDSDSDDGDGDIIGELFRLAKYEKEKKSTTSDNGIDTCQFENAVVRDWLNEQEMGSIKDSFVTGKWADNEDAEHLLAEDDELYGDFEDYETGAVHKEDEVKGKESSEDEGEKEKGDEEGDTKTVSEKEKTAQEKRMEKKKKLKELFNMQFDDKEEKSYHDDLKEEADAQGELNKKEFEDMDDETRVHYEGYWPGLYLRLEIEQMPCEFVKNFDPDYPVVVGSLLKGEDKMGYLQVRMKKHRWYHRILKSRDPLIVSLGWRRFQTTPLYYITDHNKRNRHLKYTPKHLHCMATFWGPVTQQKAGFLAVQTVSEITQNFRIAAVGSVTEVNQMTNVVKKLKLVGTPFEILKKTAFIQGMFHSPNEVAKYEGASIKTVSGIRGQIKKALRTPPGVFRATFEDKIIASDIVFLRTWVNVTVPKFCISVTSLLLAQEQKAKWQGAKTLGHLRYEKGLHAQFSEDSHYIPIERQIRQFAPLVVPKSLQMALPFKDKIVHQPKKVQNPETERVAVIREPREREIAKVMNMLKTVHKLKVKKETSAMKLRAKAHRKEKKKDEAIHHQRVQAMKKRIMRKKPQKAPEM